MLAPKLPPIMNPQISWHVRTYGVDLRITVTDTTFHDRVQNKTSNSVIDSSRLYSNTLELYRTVSIRGVKARGFARLRYII